MPKKLLLPLLIALAGTPYTPVLADCSRELAEELINTTLGLVPDCAALAIALYKLELELDADLGDSPELKELIQPELRELEAIFQQGITVALKFAESQKTVLIDFLQQALVDDKEANEVAARLQKLKSQTPQVIMLEIGLLLNNLSPENQQRLAQLVEQAQKKIMSTPEAKRLIKTIDSLVIKGNKIAQRIDDKIAAAGA